MEVIAVVGAVIGAIVGWGIGADKAGPGWRHAGGPYITKTREEKGCFTSLLFQVLGIAIGAALGAIIGGLVGAFVAD